MKRSLSKLKVKGRIKPTKVPFTSRTNLLEFESNNRMDLRKPNLYLLKVQI